MERSPVAPERRPLAWWAGSASSPRAEGGWQERGPSFLHRRGCHGELRKTGTGVAAHSKDGGDAALPAGGRLPPREAGRHRPRALSKDGGKRRSRVPGKGHHRDAFYFRVSTSRRHIVLFVKTKSERAGKAAAER